MGSLDEHYTKMAEAVKTAQISPSTEQKLTAYKLYKQINDGDVNIDRPGMFNFEGRAKWDAWNSVKGYDAERCKKLYVKEIIAQFKQYGQAPPDGIDEHLYEDAS